LNTKDDNQLAEIADSIAKAAASDPQYYNIILFMAGLLKLK
jgi:hypothetical protein